jgi:hypothetical protein
MRSREGISHILTLAFMAVAAFAAVSALIVVYEKSARADDVASTSQYSFVGGVLRRGDRPDWYLHTEGHVGVNVSDVHCDRSRGRVDVTYRNNGPVVFGSVTPDETLARAGVTAGVSATRTMLRIYLFRHDRPISCRNAIFRQPLSNLWLFWLTVDEPPSS